MKKVTENIGELSSCPVPSLEATMGRYMEVARILLSSADFLKTQSLMDEFLSKEGPRVQTALLDLARTSENWGSEYWMSERYLKDRAALLDWNVSATYPDWQINPFDQDETLRYAASLIEAAGQFKDELFRGEIKFLDPRGNPLCMEQAYRIFHSSRLPGSPVDSFVVRNDDREHYIIVCCRNELFVLNTVTNGKRRPWNQIYSDLQQIVEVALGTESRTLPVSLLTAANRDDAFSIFNQLSKADQNRWNLDVIHSSEYALCLDIHSKKISTPNASNWESEKQLYCLLGGGMGETGMNRWSHKPLQFIVADNGVSGQNSEHSPADLMNLMVQHQILSRMKPPPQDVSGERAEVSSENPTKLEWKITMADLDRLTTVKKGLLRRDQSLAMEMVYFTGFGTGFLKSSGYSTDAVVHLALQLAYFKIYGKLCSSNQTVSLLHFPKGRIDLVRQTTMETLDFVKTAATSTSSRKNVRLSFNRAATRLAQLVAEAKGGLGMEKHLVALSYLSSQINSDGKPSAIFNHPGINDIKSVKLHCSAAPPSYPKVGFPPGSKDGYAVAYSALEKSIRFNFSAWKSSKETDLSQFVPVLIQSLGEIKQWIASAKNP